MTANTPAAPPPASPPIVFMDNPHAPEVYADEAIGFFNHNGNVSITFMAARCDHSRDPASVNRVVIGRVVLPIGGAQRLALGLYDSLKKMGFDPNPPKDSANVQ